MTALVIPIIIVVGILILAGLFIWRGHSVSTTKVHGMAIGDDLTKVEMDVTHTWVGPAEHRPEPANLTLGTMRALEAATGNNRHRLSIDEDGFVLPKTRMSEKEVKELLSGK